MVGTTGRAADGKYRLMIVDDHAVLCDVLRKSINELPGYEVVSCCGSSAEAVRKAAKHRPDACILDLKLDQEDGILLIGRFRKQFPSMRIAVLSMYEHERWARRALAAGAHGYVAKSESLEGLMKAIESVRKDGAGAVCIIPRREKGKEKGKQKRRKKAVRDPLACLSEREFVTLSYLAQGMMLKEAGLRMGINVKTVTTYRARLMRKLGILNRADLVRFCMENRIVE